MGKVTVHVVPLGAGWAVKKSDSVKAIFIVQTQPEAYKIARGMALKSKTDVVVHRTNGSVERKVTYDELKKQHERNT